MVKRGFVITRSLADRLKEKGFIHTVSNNYGEIADGNSINFRVGNTMDERVIAVLLTDYPVGGVSDLEVFVNPDISASGTEMTKGVLRTGSPDVLNSTYDYGVTFDDATGNQGLDTVIPGGTQGFLSPPAGASKGEVFGAIIDPGDDVVWRVTNQSGGATRMGVEATVAEIREEVVSLP